MWSILFILPNLSLRKPVANKNIAIVPHDDSRVIEITSSNPLAKSLVEGFENQFRRKTHPSLLIINSGVPNFMTDIDVIIGFRNAFALSTIIRGHEHSLTSSFVAYPLYSDHFDFYPTTISRANDGLITDSPSVLGFDNKIQDFRGQISPGLAPTGHRSAKPDDYLFKLLEKVWERRFIKRRLNEWSTRALFRSLEMAYQASAMPSKNYSTIYDYGSSASSWVSAFEILSHPRRRNADLRSVLNLLGSYDWNDKVIKKKAYKVIWRGQMCRVNLVQKLYKELYDTRNDFLHGNPVGWTRLYPFRNKNIPPITKFAPLIYEVALLCFVDQFKDKRKKVESQEEYMSKFLDESNLSEAILKSKG